MGVSVSSEDEGGKVGGSCCIHGFGEKRNCENENESVVIGVLLQISDFYSHTHTRVQTYAQITHTHTHKHAYTHMHTYAHVHTRTYCMHIEMQTYY